jgi:hypothetical protein
MTTVCESVAVNGVRGVWCVDGRKAGPQGWYLHPHSTENGNCDEWTEASPLGFSPCTPVVVSCGTRRGVVCLPPDVMRAVNRRVQENVEHSLRGYTSLPKQVVVPGVEGPIRGTLVADYTGMKLSYLAILALEGSLDLKKLTEEQAHMIASEIVLEGEEIINRFPEGGIQRDVRMWAADVCMVHDITARLT